MKPRSRSTTAVTVEAYAHALTTGAEYVEFDIRRTGDGELAVFHDACTRHGETVAVISYARLCEQSGYEVPKAPDVMRLIAGKRGHLDLKDTGGEGEIVELAQAILGPGRFIVTTLEDPSVAAVRTRFPEVPTALWLGRGLNAASWPEQAAVRRSELFPMARVRACGADWVAVNRQLARAGVVARCHRAGIKTMVWTVDERYREIGRWLADPRVDVLITNRPEYTVRARARRVRGNRPRQGRRDAPLFETRCRPRLPRSAAGPARTRTRTAAPPARRELHRPGFHAARHPPDEMANRWYFRRLDDGERPRWDPFVTPPSLVSSDPSSSCAVSTSGNGRA